MLFLPAPFHASPLPRWLPETPRAGTPSFPFADLRLTPHYPAKSALDSVLLRVVPGADEYITEKYAFEIAQLLGEFSLALKTAPPALATLSKFLDPSIATASLQPAREVEQRSGAGVEVFRRRFPRDLVPGRDKFLREIESYLSPMTRLETAEFQIVAIEETAGPPAEFDISIRYDLVGTRKDQGREQRVGHWQTRWSRDESRGWRALRWQATEETLARARPPVFIDVTAQALGQTASYRDQMLRGVDHWRTVLDGACGIDVYGNAGLAAGDFDNDGFDDLYVCQPAGLPNRLYRNRGDGTFEDVTESSGVGVLDDTACALFADFENKGAQDLLVVCGGGPLLFRNQGNGKFSLKPDAFKFARPPLGTFTHAAIADYDRDGRLDIYFCLYSYYVGLDQYHYPVPYFDARNGPPNFLLHNDGNATFSDRTQAAGLNAENDRYSFACAWGDLNADGSPDLYVANDFGRSNLYRNNGDGTFTAISSEAGVEDAGAGMSATWLDFDNDGNQDIYVANMWSAAGLRVSEQKIFHPGDPENVRALYRGHARGNSLYRNQGGGKFQNVSGPAGAEMGRWAWSSDAWDFDHDGYPDLYIANGYISGPDPLDVSSFFWRQVVGKSPQNSNPSANYEQGWNAINELIRSDSSWAAPERNVLYANNRDGKFSEVSGVLGLDFPDDSRTFVLADIDHDGRLEVVLKNRNAPQLRVLRNAMKDIGHGIVFRLRGQKSNRDAIGSAVTVEAGSHRQTRYLQAGSGFLAQHSKELFFGLGTAEGAVRATVRWPSGLTQTFENVPVDRRIEIQEGANDFRVQPYSLPPPSYAHPGDPARLEPLPTSVETWLIEPLSAPDFSLPDLAGKSWTLQSLRGSFALLNFWSTASPACAEQMRRFRESPRSFASSGLQVIGINVDDPRNPQAVQAFVARERVAFPTLHATPDVAGVYNIVYRYLFDRRRDLPLPASFLLNKEGLIVKVYQGPVSPERLIEDAKAVPGTPADRVQRALPFPGTLFLSAFQRNDFTYGVSFFQHGYLEQAEASFRQVIAAKPDNPEAHYNLGTLYLRRNDFQDAREYLEQTVKLRPDYPEAWNNLGMVAAHDNQLDEAARNFQQALQQRPTYTIALLNLGNLYRRQGNVAEAEKLLNRAHDIDPDDPEVNYNLGMLYARQGQAEGALPYLEKAVSVRPDYPDALNNLGVLLVQEQRYPEAEQRFQDCIQVAPNFDQAYLNLARLYVILDDKEKAREVLLALLRQQPDHKMAQQALEMLH
ncbi:MAG TPA: FG-GAP-like repeat-containing protein [Terriglobales bacterium]|nr:FG-GAP-like repeat-containing protein [Terriglobales bacterium]